MTHPHSSPSPHGLTVHLFSAGARVGLGDPKIKTPEPPPYAPHSSTQPQGGRMRASSHRTWRGRARQGGKDNKPEGGEGSVHSLGLQARVPGPPPRPSSRGRRAKPQAWMGRIISLLPLPQNLFLRGAGRKCGKQAWGDKIALRPSATLSVLAPRAKGARWGRLGRPATPGPHPGPAQAPGPPETRLPPPPPAGPSAQVQPRPPGSRPVLARRGARGRAGP